VTAGSPVRLSARVGAVSDTGLQRPHNEDRFLVQGIGLPPADGAPAGSVDLSSSPLLLAVCDGMGGAAAGEVASAVAVDTLSERGSALAPEGTDPEALAAWLIEGVREANRRTLQRMRDEPGLEGMGSTLTAALLTGTDLVLAHVGDSRCFHLRDGRFRRLSLDHSFVGRLVAMGRLTEEEARRHEQRNLLLEAIGTDPEPDIDRFAAPLRAGDRVLLCSDGLSNLVPEAELREILAGADAPGEQCATLVALANDRGGDDNITVVVAHVS